MTHDNDHRAWTIPKANPNTINIKLGFSHSKAARTHNRTHHVCSMSMVFGQFGVLPEFLQKYTHVSMAGPRGPSQQPLCLRPARHGAPGVRCGPRLPLAVLIPGQSLAVSGFIGSWAALRLSWSWVVGHGAMSKISFWRAYELSKQATFTIAESHSGQKPKACRDRDGWVRSIT